MSAALAVDGAWLPCVGLAANVTASRGYVVATARGHVRPSCASWFALALIPGLALGAAVAVGAVLVWVVTDDPVVVLVDSVLIGLLATAPTLYRAWRGHERVGPFVGRVAAAVCALPLGSGVGRRRRLAVRRLPARYRRAAVRRHRRAAVVGRPCRSALGSASIPAASLLGGDRAARPGRHRRRRPPRRVTDQGV